jgi:hypothetical protein
MPFPGFLIPDLSTLLIPSALDECRILRQGSCHAGVPQSKPGARRGVGAWEPKSGLAVARTQSGGNDMLKGGLLWLIGIPIPIIILLFLFGVL